MKCLLLSLTLLPLAAFADWPQFQGPNRDGTSAEADIAREWPTTGPRTLWSTPLGEGFSGPAVRDGEVYLLDRVEDREDVLRCYDPVTGAERWKFAYNAPGSVSHNGSRATPLVTDTHVYTVGMTGQFYCFDRKTHEPDWHVDLAREFPPAENLDWGYAQSPSIYKDFVIVAPQSREGFVVAFDKTTGKVAWKSEHLGSPGYVSPLVTTLCGVDQVVMINAGANGVTGLHAADGKVLWRYGGWECRIPIPFPTVLPGDRLFITGEYGAGSAMIRLEKAGDRISVREIFTTQECESQIHQPLLVGDHLYMNSNGNNRTDGMACVTLGGELKWKTRDTRGLPRFERGGLLLADGLIVNFDGDRGTLHLIDPSPEAYKEIASAPIFEGQKMWSPMALADGKLVLRSQNELKCLDLRNP